MCGGFTCSKNALTALNILYIIVSFILIGVAAYGTAASIVTNIAIIAAIIGCGVFLFLLSLLGLIGAIKHHQVLLFFYMVILFLLFVVQFSIACACLAFNKEQQREMAEKGWRKASFKIKGEAQRMFHCCGFLKLNVSDASMRGPDCKEVTVCCNDQQCNCPPCYLKLQDEIDYALKISGGIGLFFSFTEFIGVWLTVRYRNQKDSRANPSAFL
ncbi:tetraspanin-13 isoform X1 [Centruroides vittatus]|uniref:tetraspanin-13 isoform X1 n=1 Tax=Centruroides vittatus TaxID=120091 RepID=UPI00350F300B